MNKIKIAIVVSHPIQHFCPVYASWATINEIKLKVFFASATGVKSYFDPSFNKEISWNRLYLDRFEHEFLNNAEVIDINENIDAPELDTKLDIYNPDLIIVYGYIQRLQLRAWKWAKQNNKKIFMISDAELRHSRPLYIRLLKKLIIPRRLKRFDAFLTVGDANEEYYTHYGVPKERFFRSPFPIDIFLYEQANEQRENLRTQIRKIYNISDDDIILTNVGKFVKWKRQIDIIRALKMLENEEKRLVLFLIGSGEEEKNLSEEAGKLKLNKVIFTGFVNPEELPAYYVATDIYIHPSEQDAHPLSVSEAVFLGCPVILSDKCGSYGNNDEVRPSINGIIYEAGNIKILCSTIQKLVENKILREKFASNSLKIGAELQNMAHKDGIKRLLTTFNKLNSI